MFRILIILTFLILHSSTAYCQITQTDKGLVITRQFAEFVAARFDSLKTFKELYFVSVAALDSCVQLVGNTEQLDIAQERKIAGQAEEIAALWYLVDSYKKQEVITTNIQKQLKKETRKRKFWQLVGFGTGAGLLTTIFILAL